MFKSEIKAVIGWPSGSLAPLHTRALFLLLLFPFSLAAQTGGTYDLTHAVIASGGATQSTEGSYAVGGTAGQSLAGGHSMGGNYQLRGGFWVYDDFVPTAANVSIGGRIYSASGLGIQKVRVVLRPQVGSARYALSSTFGFYRFDDVPVGESYIIEVYVKRYQFQHSSILINVTDEIYGIDFVALP